MEQRVSPRVIALLSDHYIIIMLPSQPFQKLIYAAVALSFTAPFVLSTCDTSSSSNFKHNQNVLIRIKYKQVIQYNNAVYA